MSDQILIFSQNNKRISLIDSCDSNKRIDIIINELKNVSEIKNVEFIDPKSFIVTGTVKNDNKERSDGIIILVYDIKVFKVINYKIIETCWLEKFFILDNFRIFCVIKTENGSYYCIWRYDSNEIIDFEFPFCGCYAYPIKSNLIVVYRESNWDDIYKIYNVDTMKLDEKHIKIPLSFYFPYGMVTYISCPPKEYIFKDGKYKFLVNENKIEKLFDNIVKDMIFLKEELIYLKNDGTLHLEGSNKQIYKPKVNSLISLPSTNEYGLVKDNEIEIYNLENRKFRTIKVKDKVDIARLVPVDNNKIISRLFIKQGFISMNIIDIVIKYII